MSEPKDFNYVYAPTFDSLAEVRKVVINNTCDTIVSPLPTTTPTASTRSPFTAPANGKWNSLYGFRLHILALLDELIIHVYNRSKLVRLWVCAMAKITTVTRRDL